MAHVLIIGGRRVGATCDLAGALLVAVAGVGVLGIRPAAAETLEQAWQLALQHDYGLAAATAELEGARSSERAARAARWPSLVASTGYTRFRSAPAFDFAAPGFALQLPIFAGDDYASGAVQMNVPLYAGGRISAEIGAARHATVAASDAKQVAQASLKLGVAQAYVDVLRARRSLQSAESSVASLTAHAGDVERMVNRELVARSDLLAARVALANAEQQRVRADNGVALAYAAYNRRLGGALDRRPELEDVLPVDLALAEESIEALVKQALESRSELGALSARSETLAMQSRAELAPLRPQLMLTGGYTYLETEILDRKDFTSVGVAVIWNLFDGGQARNRSAALRSASQAARQRADDLRSQLELEVRQAWLGVREARARVNASREVVAEAEENLRITRELYGAGLGTNTQVLDAVALQVAAMSNHDNATLDESLSLLTLARAVGAL